MTTMPPNVKNDIFIIRQFQFQFQPHIKQPRAFYLFIGEGHCCLDDSVVARDSAVENIGRENNRRLAGLLNDFVSFLSDSFFFSAWSIKYLFTNL
jgi:hypothetical protein